MVTAQLPVKPLREGNDSLRRPTGGSSGRGVCHQGQDAALADVVRGDQLDYAEIADYLGIPSGTLKSRIHAARQHVRASLYPA
jgi:hypothetical protein